MNKDKLRLLLDSVKVLEESMKMIVIEKEDQSVWKFSSFNIFLRKYNEIAISAAQEIKENRLYDIYDLTKIPSADNTTGNNQKNYFHAVLVNAGLLKTVLENKLDVKNDEILNLKNFLISNLRKGVMEDPVDEIYIQNVIEQLLIGKGLNKGIDYDRETGRVKISIKEFKPDFIFPKLSLALEVKLSKSKAKSREIVDEINADIQAYSKEYKQILFVVYDMGTIRDENEFKNDIDNKSNIQLIVIKN